MGTFFYRGWSWPCYTHRSFPNVWVPINQRNRSKVTNLLRLFLVWCHPDWRPSYLPSFWWAPAPGQTSLEFLSSFSASVSLEIQMWTNNWDLTSVSGAGGVVPPIVIHKVDYFKRQLDMKGTRKWRVAATNKGYITKVNFMSMVDGLWPTSSKMDCWECHTCLSVTATAATCTTCHSSYLWRSTISYRLPLCHLFSWVSVLVLVLVSV